MSEHEYKVGDKVEVVTDAVAPENVGRIGRVIGTTLIGAWPYEVEFDGDYDVFAAADLKLLSATNADEPDMVEHPNHYSAGTPDGIEVIDILRAHEAAGGTWETMNALKYILRFPFKGNAAQDLAKAERYLGMWKERESA